MRDSSDVRKGAFPTVSESTLASLWQRAHTLAEGLVSEDGQRFRVLYPGRPNPRAGPDFHDAIVVTGDGQQITGDVELHVSAPDWYRHGHHFDPNYNGVVLHVVLRTRGGCQTIQRSGMVAPVVSIAGMASRLAGSEDRPPDSRVDEKPNGFEDFGEALDRAGDQRFFSRSRGYSLEIIGPSPDQVLYRALLEALGYAVNRKPFRELAERAPITVIMRLRDEPPLTRLMAIKAVLLHAAGLLSHVTAAEEARQMKSLVKLLPSDGTMAESAWRLFRVRPVNHPVVRIVGVANLLERFMETGLTAGLASVVLSGDPAKVRRSLTVPGRIGKGRAGDIAVNVVLPFLHAYAGVTRSRALTNKCVHLYRAYPRLEENEITREMRRLLGTLTARTDVVGARRQQGLIHLYKTMSRTARENAEGPESGDLRVVLVRPGADHQPTPARA